MEEFTSETKEGIKPGMVCDILGEIKDNVEK